MGLCVKTSTMTRLSPYAAPMVLDFGDQASGDQRVVAYAVALSYFKLMFQDDGEISEDVGQLSVTLITNQVGNALHVTANLVLSDYDGAQAAEPADDADMESFVRVTAIAYLDTTSAPVTLGNLYGLAGSQAGFIPVPSGSAVAAFLAGFHVQLGARSEIDGFRASCEALPPVAGSDDAGVSASASLPGDAAARAATADVAFFAGGGITSYELVRIPTNAELWREAGESRDGVKCDFSVRVPLEEGESIASAGVVLQEVQIDYSTRDPIEFIEAGAGGDELQIKGDSVSGTLRMAMYNNSMFDAVIAPPPASSMSAFVLAQIRKNENLDRRGRA